MDKKALRNTYHKLREVLTEEVIEKDSIAIANQLLSLPIWEGTYYHIFLPITTKKEVNTEYILHILQGRDKSIVIPKSNFKTGSMQAILLQENTLLALSDYGITEPLEGIEIAPQQIDLVFIPLLAFDEKGNRLGYGKGFYDRFLNNCSQNCIKIGLSFFKAEKSIPTNNYDIPLDYCVTPEKVYKFS